MFARGVGWTDRNSFQGKLLGVPENVPFRMTADIVDGMGTSGTAGVFQRCAEETLRVLRDQSGVIMTVLEVFKHDPLHSWTVSEIKMKQLQSDMAPPTPVTPAANLTDANDGYRCGQADEYRHRDRYVERLSG
jgi:ataxia telangiectasia mutated family protein